MKYTTKKVYTSDGRQYDLEIPDDLKEGQMLVVNGLQYLREEWIVHAGEQTEHPTHSEVVNYGERVFVTQDARQIIYYWHGRFYLSERSGLSKLYRYN